MYEKKHTKNLPYVHTSLERRPKIQVKNPFEPTLNV